MSDEKLFPGLRKPLTAWEAIKRFHEAEANTDPPKPEPPPKPLHKVEVLLDPYDVPDERRVVGAGVMCAGTVSDRVALMTMAIMQFISYEDEGFYHLDDDEKRRCASALRSAAAEPAGELQ